MKSLTFTNFKENNSSLTDLVINYLCKAKNNSELCLISMDNRAFHFQ